MVCPLFPLFPLLYDTSNEHHWLTKARKITDVMLNDFWDKEQGGFFMAAQSDVAPQMQRLKEVHDGAIPSGNSVAVKVLAELDQRTGEVPYRDKALATVSVFSEQIIANPAAYSYMLVGMDQLLSGETMDVQYAARGAATVRGQLQAVDNNKYHL